MDALKLAFDALIVGALAAPWLAIVLRIFVPPGGEAVLKKQIGFLSLVSDKAQDALVGVLLVAIGYSMGCSVSRVASDFFNDEFWYKLPRLPTGDEIREAVYCQQANPVFGFTESQSAAFGGIMRDTVCAFKIRIRPKGSEIDKAKTAVANAFRRQESTVLIAGPEKTDRLARYNEQIIVLRGGALNGIILLFLSIFGCCAIARNRWGGWWKPLSFVPVLTVLGSGLWLSHLALQGDSTEHGFSDPPLAEAVLILLGITGIFVRGKDVAWAFYLRFLALGLVLTLILYGAWWWTEVLYDQTVIDFFHVVGPSAT
jgi:hypothetical protein